MDDFPSVWNIVEKYIDADWKWQKEVFVKNYLGLIKCTKHFHSRPAIRARTDFSSWFFQTQMRFFAIETVKWMLLKGTEKLPNIISFSKLFHGDPIGHHLPHKTDINQVFAGYAA